MVLDLLYNRTFPLLFVCQVYGVWGFSGKNPLKARIFHIYSFLVIILHVCLFFLNYKKFNVNKMNGHEFIRFVIWVVHFILIIIIPSHLMSFSRAKQTIVHIVNKCNVDLRQLNFKKEIIFLGCEFVADAFGILFWYICDAEAMYELYALGIAQIYSVKLYVLTLLKYTVMIRILASALKNFNDNLEKLEDELNKNDPKNCQSKIKALKQQLLNIMNASREMSSIMSFTVFVFYTVSLFSCAFILLILLKTFTKPVSIITIEHFTKQVISEVISTVFVSYAGTAVINEVSTVIIITYAEGGDPENRNN